MTKDNPTPVAGSHKSCPSCGGQLRYDITTKKLICESCKNSRPVGFFSDPDSSAREMEVLEYRCPQCGARLHTTATNMVSYCSHCGSDVQFTQRMTHTRRPDSIIPFRVTREKCEEAYREYMGRQLKADQPLHFQPVYVPFYLYRETYEGSLNGQYVEEDSEDSEYIVYTTREQTFDAKVTIRGEMECASSQFEAETADQLQICADDLKSFSPGYLCGFFAEAPDLDANVEESRLDVFASEMSKTHVGQAMNRRITALSLPPKTEDTAQLVLAPVWLLAKGNGRRVLYTAISGIDGRIVCDKPVSGKKIFLTAALIAAVLFALLYLLSSRVILQPNVVITLCALLASAGYYCINTHLTRHNRNMQVFEQRKETKRCDVLRGHKDVLNITAIQLGWQHLLPVITLVGGLLFMLVILALQSHFLLYLSFPVVGFTLRITIAAIGNIITIHRTRRDLNMPVLKEGSIREWLILYGAWPLLGALVAFVITWISQNYNAAVGLLVSDHSRLPAAMCAYSALSLMIQLAGAKLDGTDTGLCVGEIIVALFAALALVCNPAKWGLHCLSILLLLPLVFSMVRINRRHNEFISRPVPFFGEEGEK